MSDDEDWDKDFVEDGGFISPIKLSLPPDKSVSKDDEKSASAPAIMLKRPIEIPKMTSSEDDPFDDDEDNSFTQTPKSSVDGDVQLPKAAPNLGKSLRYQDSSDDEKWDDDFDNAPKDPVMQIRGIKADPNKKEEDWDEDFDFGGPEIPTGKSLLRDPSGRSKLQMSRVHSSAIMSATDKVSTLLRDILTNYPVVATDKQRKKSKVVRHMSVDDSEDGFGEDDRDRSYSAGGPQQIVQEGKSSLQQAKENVQSGDTAEALKNLKIAQNALGGLFQRDKEFALEAEVYYLNGVLTKNEPMEAVPHFKYSIDLMNQAKFDTDPTFRPEVYLELASCYMSLKNYSSAATHLADLLRILLAPNYSSISWNYVGKSCMKVANCLKELNMGRDLISQYLYKCEEAAKLAEDSSVALEAEEMLKAMPDIPKTPSKSSSLFESLKLKPQVIQSDNLSLSASETESDAENWDIELGLEGQQRQTLTLASTGQPTKMNTNHDGDERVPKRYKFLDSLKQDVEIIKYPKATFFYGMKTAEGHKLLGEQALEAWLSNLISKHPTAVTYRDGLDNYRSKTVRELQQDFANLIQSARKLSIEWAKSHLQFCTTLYMLKHNDVCWETLYSFFVDLPDCNISRMAAIDQHREYKIYMHILFIFW